MLSRVLRAPVSKQVLRPVRRAARRAGAITARAAAVSVAMPWKAGVATFATATAATAAVCFTTAAACEAADVRGKPQVVFVLGGPGAGKGTQCGLIVEKYGFVHLSAGDLLRKERNSGSENGALIQSYIAEGNIVPVEITVNLLKKAMEENTGKLFLIDGFPRNFDNNIGWERVMGDSVDVKFVLFYDTSEEVMQERLISRGKTSGRTDDNLATIKKRFRTYLNSTMPVVEVYDKQGKVRRVCSSAAVDKVFEDTKRVIEPVVKDHLLGLSKELLKAVDSGDSETYAELCTTDMTAFEPESDNLLVKGIDFHTTFLNGPSSGSISHITNPNVDLFGDVAVITYNRVQQTASGSTSTAETRVWHRNEGNQWKHVHFHRSGRV